MDVGRPGPRQGGWVQGVAWVVVVGSVGTKAGLEAAGQRAGGISRHKPCPGATATPYPLPAKETCVPAASDPAHPCPAGVVLGAGLAAVKGRGHVGDAAQLGAGLILITPLGCVEGDGMGWGGVGWGPAPAAHRSQARLALKHARIAAAKGSEASGSAAWPAAQPPQEAGRDGREPERVPQPPGARAHPRPDPSPHLQVGSCSQASGMSAWSASVLAYTSRLLQAAGQRGSNSAARAEVGRCAIAPTGARRRCQARVRLGQACGWVGGWAPWARGPSPSPWW